MVLVAWSPLQVGQHYKIATLVVHCHIITSRGDQMSRASTSGSGRPGNPKVMDSNLDLAVFEPWLSPNNDFKIDTCYSLARHLALLGYDKDWLAQCRENATEWVCLWVCCCFMP